MFDAFATYRDNVFFLILYIMHDTIFFFWISEFSEGFKPNREFPPDFWFFSDTSPKQIWKNVLLKNLEDPCQVIGFNAKAT